MKKRKMCGMRSPRCRETAAPDDTDTEALINGVKEQYDGLTEHEKSLISDELTEKLERLLDDLLDYRIMKATAAGGQSGTTVPSP